MPDEPLGNPDNRLVDNPAQAVENIRRYQTELDKDSGSARNLHVRLMKQTSHWYAVKSDGRWLFAPSKFIGYRDDNAEDYSQNARKRWSGTKTEKRLRRWFEEPKDVEAELRPALLSFLEEHKRSPRKGARIHVLKEDTSVNDAPVDGEERRDRNSEEPERQREPRPGPGASPLNTILYGPPGTGKTYATARRCVDICDGKADHRSEEDIRRRYRELVDEDRVEFITFHQSYGYEEFVEGLRPPVAGPMEEYVGPVKEETSAGFRLDPVDGVLKRISDHARKTPGRTDASFDLSERQVFKMGLGIPRIENHIFDECITNNYVLLGWGGEIDWSDRRYGKIDNILARWQKEDPEAKTQNINIQSVMSFRNRMKKGDIIIVPASGGRFRAVGEVTDDYEFCKRDEGDYPHRRSVHWHWYDEKGMPVSDIYDGVLTPKTIYRLRQERIKTEHLIRYTSPVADSSHRLPHVLVIDEINRANVSKVLGELVTLLEEDKREGGPNEVAVKLPYSRERFTLPVNLHVLGTMNTADRSIALLDTALRRRFEFEELPPDPDLLTSVDGINLPAVLRAINKRLEYLIDRDHLIGHAWLMGAKTRADVDHIMRRKIIPLIAEYFHDDWNKVRAILGSGFVSRKRLSPPPGLDNGMGEKRYRWKVRDSFAADAYARLISGVTGDAQNLKRDKPSP